MNFYNAPKRGDVRVWYLERNFEIEHWIGLPADIVYIFFFSFALKVYLIGMGRYEIHRIKMIQYKVIKHYVKMTAPITETFINRMLKKEFVVFFVS